jgi:hypothetical protein
MPWAVVIESDLAMEYVFLSRTLPGRRTPVK